MMFVKVRGLSDIYSELTIHLSYNWTKDHQSRTLDSSAALRLEALSHLAIETMWTIILPILFSGLATAHYAIKELIIDDTK
jgi:hypothetical protein